METNNTDLFQKLAEVFGGLAADKKQPRKEIYYGGTDNVGAISGRHNILDLGLDEELIIEMSERDLRRRAEDLEISFPDNPEWIRKVFHFLSKLTLYQKYQQREENLWQEMSMIGVNPREGNYDDMENW